MNDQISSSPSKQLPTKNLAVIVFVVVLAVGAFVAYKMFNSSNGLYNTSDSSSDASLVTNQEVMFGDKLSECIKYEDTYTDNQSGKTLERKILGMSGETCNYQEQTADGGRMTCAYTEEQRKIMAAYYVDKDLANTANTDVVDAETQEVLEADGPDFEVKYIIGDKEVTDPLQEFIDTGVCKTASN